MMQWEWWLLTFIGGGFTGSVVTLIMVAIFRNDDADSGD